MSTFSICLFIIIFKFLLIFDTIYGGDNLERNLSRKSARSQSAPIFNPRSLSPPKMIVQYRNRDEPKRQRDEQRNNKNNKSNKNILHEKLTREAELFRERIELQDGLTEKIEKWLDDQKDIEMEKLEPWQLIVDKDDVEDKSNKDSDPPSSPVLKNYPTLYGKSKIMGFEDKRVLNGKNATKSPLIVDELAMHKEFQRFISLQPERSAEMRQNSRGRRIEEMPSPSSNSSQNHNLKPRLSRNATAGSSSHMSISSQTHQLKHSNSSRKQTAFMPPPLFCGNISGRYHHSSKGFGDLKSMVSPRVWQHSVPASPTSTIRSNRQSIAESSIQSERLPNGIYRPEIGGRFKSMKWGTASSSQKNEMNRSKN